MLRPVSCVVVLVTQSWPTLCESMNCSLAGSSVHGILQARTLEWVAIPFSRWSSQPKDQTRVSCIASNFFTVWATRDAPVPYPFNHSSASWCPDLLASLSEELSLHLARSFPISSFNSCTFSAWRERDSQVRHLKTKDESWDRGWRGGGVCSYDWFVLLYGKNQHNIVKQLSSN